MTKVGFLGAGKIAQALAKGFIAAELTQPANVIASCPKHDSHLLDAFKKLGCETTFDNNTAVQRSDVVVLATKPDHIPDILPQINRVVKPEHLFVSVAMGTSTRYLEQMLPARTRVMRVMPNTPVMVREGATVVCSGSAATSDDAILTKQLFSAVGLCEEVPEKLLDVVTGMSGSGPAYIYLAIEAMADGGVKMGLPRHLAYSLAAQTCLGSALMVMKTGRHPGDLKDDVCSPGGTTIDAVHLLEKNGFRFSLMAAVQAATEKAKSISQEE